jgi:hypothetical protein
MEKTRTICAVITMLLNLAGLTLFTYINHAAIAALWR